mmetsp:Transcript_50836/g.164422  ORF Transcript_50836/g.164422 Transcript_50836/m.164422 type:complete len:264 (-) Transcript_50836:1025-1816(-)
MVCRAARQSLSSRRCSGHAAALACLAGNGRHGGRGGWSPVDGLIQSHSRREALAGAFEDVVSVGGVAVLVLLAALGAGLIVIHLAVVLPILLLLTLLVVSFLILVVPITCPGRRHRRRRPALPPRGTASGGVVAGAGRQLHRGAPEQLQARPVRLELVQGGLSALQGSDHPHGARQVLLPGLLVVALGEAQLVLRDVNVHGLRVHGDAPDVRARGVDDAVTLGQGPQGILLLLDLPVVVRLPGLQLGLVPLGLHIQRRRAWVR